MTTLRIMAGAAIAAAGLSSAPPAGAYPIDCAILLCLAGGWPASAECSAARAEFIRRITPWPVEPPLQLWNCPMSVPAELAAAIGLIDAGLGADGLTPEVRAYRDGVEIYHIRQYRRWRNRDGVQVTDITERGAYDTDGRFRWVPASYVTGPAWLADAAGDTTSRAGLTFLRAVAVRTRDHDGQYTTEFVRY